MEYFCIAIARPIKQFRRLGEGFAEAAVVKDAGDDPDVTHGATVHVRVELLEPGGGVQFRAGPGVGTATLPGLPIAVGEPAINPAPRAMMREAIAGLAAGHGAAGDVVITISIDGGEALAQKTWNPRLGILGGLSILGTTGIVLPYSCSAWIHSIHSGIDVARASGFDHVAGSTGKTSEAAVKRHYGLADVALLDMGDFAGGMLKYLRRHPLPWITIAGGFAKLTKLAQGHLDLHSSRSQVDFDDLALTDLVDALEAEGSQGVGDGLGRIEAAELQCAVDAHQDRLRSGASVGTVLLAVLPQNHGRANLAFREVVLKRHVRVIQKREDELGVFAQTLRQTPRVAVDRFLGRQFG